MIYQMRRDDTGEIIEIVRSMKSPPADTEIIDGHTCRRVYTVPLVSVKGDQHSTKYAQDDGGPPISRFLPPLKGTAGVDYDVVSRGNHTIREYRDGSRTDKDGCRIVENSHDIKCIERAGFKRESD